MKNLIAALVILGSIATLPALADHHKPCCKEPPPCCQEHKDCCK